MLFRIELIWKGGERASETPSIYLVADRSVILQGTNVPEHERDAMHLPKDQALIRVDREMIRAIKEML